MKAAGGRGVLMGGVPGVHAARLMLSAGVSGLNAAAIAVGMQADVSVLDLNIDRLRAVDQIYRGQLRTVASNAFEIERAVLDADMVIGAVLIPGAKAPTLATNELVSRMKPGSVLVDISMDQGGCCGTRSRPRTRTRLMPCTIRSSTAWPTCRRRAAHLTHALTNVTLPYAVALAGKGWQQACADDPSLSLSVNTPATWSTPPSAKPPASRPHPWPRRSHGNRGVCAYRQACPAMVRRLAGALSPGTGLRPVDDVFALPGVRQWLETTSGPFRRTSFTSIT